MQGTNFLLAALHLALRRVESSTVDELRAELPAEFDSVLREQFGGQTLRFYVRKTQRTERVDRDQRIEAALSQGEAPIVISERENVSKRHIRRVRARFI